MRARPVAIEGARIVDFEGASLVVEAPVVGRVLVPSEMIDDDSEIWRVGESGTLLVEGAWAKQRGLKGKRKPRAAPAPVAGAPVELGRKAAWRPPPPPQMPEPVPGPAPALGPSRSKTHHNRIRNFQKLLAKARKEHGEEKPFSGPPQKLSKARWECPSCGATCWHVNMCSSCKSKRPTA